MVGDIDLSLSVIQCLKALSARVLTTVLNSELFSWPIEM